MKITKAIWDLLPDQHKTEFIVNPANADEYDNGEEKAEGLKSALAAERIEKANIAKQRDALLVKETEAEKTAREAREKAIKEAGNVGDIEKMYQEKIAANEKAAKETLATREKEIQRLALETEVIRIASLFTIPDVMGDTIRKFLKCEFDANGTSIIRVLDDNGNATVDTLREFQEKLLAKPQYKSIVPASSGSGSGATKPYESGSGATPTKISDFKTATEESLFANANPVAYNAMIEARKAERGY